MNTTDHHKIVRMAIEALPEPSRKFWNLFRDRIIGACMLPDDMAVQLLNGEDGPWRRYFPPAIPKHSFEKSGAAARAHFFDIRFYTDRIIELLMRNEIDEACGFTGVFAHHIGDFCEPAHYYEREITLLLPPPADMLNCNSHRMIEDTPSTVTAIDYAPRILGDNSSTITMGIESRLREAYELSLASIIPILEALYRRDKGTAGKTVNRVIVCASEIISDFLYTVYCLHKGGLTHAERQQLAACPLETLEPAAYDVEFIYGCRPIRTAFTPDRTGYAMPLQLRIRNGSRTEIQTVRGLAVIPHALPIHGTDYLASVDYDLPDNTFTRFTCNAGLMVGYTPQAICVFTVEGDGKTVFRSDEMEEFAPSLEIDADITGISKLRLIVSTDRSTDKLAVAIWGNPLLHR